jgi:hypothetical protein
MRGTDFSEMAAFVEIAERGNFASAAKHLGVGVSTYGTRWSFGVVLPKLLRTSCHVVSKR